MNWAPSILLSISYTFEVDSRIRPTNSQRTETWPKKRQVFAGSYIGDTNDLSVSSPYWEPSDIMFENPINFPPCSDVNIMVGLCEFSKENSNL